MTTGLSQVKTNKGMIALILCPLRGHFSLSRQHDQQERERSVQRLSVASRPHSPHTLNKVSKQQFNYKGLLTSI